MRKLSRWSTKWTLTVCSITYMLQGSHASWKVLDFFFKIPGHGKSWKITLDWKVLKSILENIHIRAFLVNFDIWRCAKFQASQLTGPPNTRVKQFSTNMHLNHGTVIDRGIFTVEDEYEVVCGVSNSAIFDDLDWPWTSVSRSQYRLEANILQTVHLINSLGFQGWRIEWHYLPDL